jgi:uncharacterized membrane protein
MREDYTLELLISRILRTGVQISGSLVFGGWLAQYTLLESNFSDLKIYRTTPFGERLTQILRAKEWGQVMIYIGLVVLISLPLIRVCLTCFLFIKEKEYLLSMVSGCVLLGLLLSIFIGFQV